MQNERGIKNGKVQRRGVSDIFNIPSTCISQSITLPPCSTGQIEYLTAKKRSLLLLQFV